MTLTIMPATSPADFADFARLVGDYVAWCRARYSEDAWFVDQALSHQSLAAELAELPVKYSPPAGRALLARQDGEACGCVAYRWRGADTVEMKRLFVSGRFKGKGLGRALCARLIAMAEEDGCRLMLLDTADRLHEAIALYESLGFRRRSAYNDYPPELMAYLIFMERPLAG